MIKENKTGFKDQDILRLAVRENNNKRGYLLVNPAQAKHVPADPSATLNLFGKLGREVAKEANISNKKSMVIGFAETATAIGAAVAAACGGGTFYLHTTREHIKGAEPVVNFLEEHSHATNQLLYCNNWEKAMDGVFNIIFVEDEVTTGKTIINFAKALKDKGLVSDDVRLCVASIINGMNNDNEDRFIASGISMYYLVKTDNEGMEDAAAMLAKAKGGIKEKSYLTGAKVDLREIDILSINRAFNPRLGVIIKDYDDFCTSVGDMIIDRIGKDNFKRKRTLILGTEECMYPAIKAGAMIGAYSNEAVMVHATTRSPINTFDACTYPLNARYELSSLYDDNRTTYIYNLEVYDYAIIITDSDEVNTGFYQLQGLLKALGCKDVLFVRL